MSRHKFHGDPERFQRIAEFVGEEFGRDIKYIADVAGGQGMLSRLLRKQYNYEAEVIDPREYRLVGVPGLVQEYKSELARRYDLVIGLHPDQATRAIAESALVTNTLIIPCCNFWDRENKLGVVELVEAIEAFYRENNVKFERITFDFKGPKNIGIVTYS
jgi:hypothetical protein